MRLLHKSVTWMMLASFFGVPVMACMAPATQLTPEEKSCCEAMDGKCDEMGMGKTSHSCCQPKVSSVSQVYVAHAKDAHVAPSFAAVLLRIVVSVIAPVCGMQHSAYANLDPSPPGSQTLNILRI